MKHTKYIYGPVPSRRLGLSLGVSPIPKKTCNYSCIYCQLGRTQKMTNTRQVFFDPDEILKELDRTLAQNIKFDAVTIVGEGEPTLYAGLGTLIREIKKRTDRPLAVISNAALFYQPELQKELMPADIILPSMDAFDEQSFKKINRPHGAIKYKDVRRGLIDFSKNYTGQLWLEIMFLKNINDSDAAIDKYRQLLQQIDYDRLYINTPVRPPAEADVEMTSKERLKYISEKLGGISIDLLASEGFYSDIKDTYAAILSIIKRHPMNQFEIESFIDSRKDRNKTQIFNQLNNDKKIEVISYKGYNTYRLS